MSRPAFQLTEETMLVLSRKTGEKLLIGSDVEITITRVAKGRVQLGIAAPQDICIRRGELSLSHTSKTVHSAKPR